MCSSIFLNFNCLIIWIKQMKSEAIHMIWKISISFYFSRANGVGSISLSYLPLVLAYKQEIEMISLFDNIRKSHLNFFQEAWEKSYVKAVGKLYKSQIRTNFLSSGSLSYYIIICISSDNQFVDNDSSYHSGHCNRCTLKGILKY